MNYTDILNILYQRFPLEICYKIMSYMEHPTAVILREAGFSVEEWYKHLRLNIDDEQFTYCMIYGQLGCSEGWLGGWIDPEIREAGWLMKDIKNCKICDIRFPKRYGVEGFGLNAEGLCEHCDRKLIMNIFYGKFLD